MKTQEAEEEDLEVEINCEFTHGRLEYLGTKQYCHQVDTLIQQLSYESAWLDLLRVLLIDFTRA